MSNPPAALAPARHLAPASKHAARLGVLEKDFRQAVKAHPLQLAPQKGMDLAHPPFNDRGLLDDLAFGTGTV